MINRLTCPLLLKSHHDDGFFCGYASVFDVVDDQRDCVARGAFTKSLSKFQKLNQHPKMLWQHDIGKPIGCWTKLYEDGQGLFVEGQLLLDIQAGREAHALLKAGIVDSLSIGFRLLKSHKDNKQQTRILDEIDLFEISLVTFAANTQAKIIAHKDSLANSDNEYIKDQLTRLANNFLQV